MPTRKKILLVDDDPAVRQMLARLLTGENYAVLPAENGTEAFAVAAATPLDLALLDLNLPGQSGWDIFERLSTENPLLPIIIITARPNQLFVALAAGVGALLEKPLDFPKLLETIEQLLAEPAETRLARIAGKATDFHYLPQSPKAKHRESSSAKPKTGVLPRIEA